MPLRISLQHIFLLIILFPATQSLAQNPVAIASKKAESWQFTRDIPVLQAAISRTIGETGIEDMDIREKAGQVYLFARVRNKKHSGQLAISLKRKENTLLLSSDCIIYKCFNAACKDCELFIENGKIVGCICNTTKSISNHCRYTKDVSGKLYEELRGN